jgi:GTP-sensing pleiotropic transcriptional regulator CodY
MSIFKSLTNRSDVEQQVIVQHEKMPKFKSLYKRPDAGLATELDYKTMVTIQSEKEACDAKNIVARHKIVKGFDIFDNYRDASVSNEVIDLTTLPSDFVQAQNQINYAQQQFEALPSKIRKSFNNNSREFLSFVQNPENIEDLVKMGLATQRPVEKTNVKEKNENIQNNSTNPANNASAS